MSAPVTSASLPRSGNARRALQAKGQFWTPAWVAEAMAAYVLGCAPDVVFDPAVGAGAFFTACRSLGYAGDFAGCESDASALTQAYGAGLDDKDMRDVQARDFFEGGGGKYSAIVSNPPYLRHHRIPSALKLRLQFHARTTYGLEIDGRAGLHVHFLLHCLERLAPGGRLAFLLPADTCEGVFAGKLWTWITRNYNLRNVITFAPEAAPFPGVDTNVFVVALENTPAQAHFNWARMRVPDRETLSQLLRQEVCAHPDVDIFNRELSEAIETGLTRPPRRRDADELRLGEVASVMRGIATGANEFFFLTRRQISEQELKPSWFKRAVGRTRDCPVEILDPERLEILDDMGRPTWLLDLPDVPLEKLPAAARKYLRKGKRLATPDRALIRMRKRWYRMEQREPPPILFAYLGRRSCRFILNRAGVLPLTGFLCVYPRAENRLIPESLWRLLNEPETLAGLALVGKTYGSGAIKVEPRALERLPLPHAVCKKYGVTATTEGRQLTLMEAPAKYKIASYTCKSTRKPD